tara:strand:+ start:2658 stop:3383 length:726 start_codon:yes stop_codon:yes gene_type:complete
MEILKTFNTHSQTIKAEHFVKKFNNKRVLVLGSGPSARDRNWQNLDFDCIATCNFFYKNDEVRKLKNITHISLGDMVDLNDERLNSFLDENEECTISFEPKPHPFYVSEPYRKFNVKYRERIVFYIVEPHTSNMEGTAGRAIYFVVGWQPSHVYYVGIDGSSSIGKDGINYFDKNLIGTRDNYDLSRYKKSYVEMANLLYKFNQEYGIKFYNLGEGLEYNMSSEVSEKLFPLTDEIKAKIL